MSSFHLDRVYPEILVSNGFFFGCVRYSKNGARKSNLIWVKFPHFYELLETKGLRCLVASAYVQQLTELNFYTYDEFGYRVSHNGRGFSGKFLKMCESFSPDIN